MKIIISTCEYIRRLNRVQYDGDNKCRDTYQKEISKHQKKLGKYMDARERRNSTRNRNGSSLDEQIESTMNQIAYIQQKIDEINANLKRFKEIYEYDGTMVTEEQIRSRVGTDARLDYGFLQEREEPEVKQEPMEDVKEEIKEEIKEEPEDIALPNVVKVEPQ